MNRFVDRSFHLATALPMLGLLFVEGCSGSSTTSDNAVGGSGTTVPGGQGGSLVAGSGGTGTLAVSVGGAGATSTAGTTPTTTGGATAASNGGAEATGGLPANTTSQATTTSAVGGTKASGGTSAAGGTKASGGTTSSTGGSKASGGTTSSSTGGTSAAGGTKASGGTTSSSTGGTKAAGGTTSSTGGTKAAGGTTSSAGGSASTCGSTTLNQNPFGCSFAWGLSDPGGSLSAYNYLSFMTFWIDWGIAADGTISTYLGANWLKNYVASTTLVPVYYGYIIGYYAHANGIVDGNQCPAGNPNCPNLTNNGAAFVRTNRAKIIQAYANYAKQSYAVWPTRPLVWLLEGDFIQFTASSQSSPLTMAELGKLAADITCAIKGNMPNAVVAINHSTWNQNTQTNDYWNAMKSAGVNYDMAWTTGVANSNGFFNSSITATSYNGSTATYAYLHQVSGRKIFIDDGCGAETNEDWSTSTASTLNTRIAAGVAAFNHCGKLKSTYQSLTAALKSQLSSTCN